MMVRSGGMAMRPLSRLPISDTDMHAGYGRRIMTAEATMDRILIVDDHPLVRDGLRSVIAVTFDQCEILEAASLEPETTYYTLDGRLNEGLVRGKIRKVSHVYTKDFVNLLCRMVISAPEERIDV